MKKIITLFAATMFLSLAQADAYPSKTITFIVPVGPGTGADSTTRVIADLVSKDLKVPVIVENKPGADGIIATQYMLASPADGYKALMYSPSTFILATLLKKNLPYQLNKDLTPLAISVRAVAGYVVRGDSKMNTIHDLLAEAQKRPGQVSLAHYGGDTYATHNSMLEKFGNAKFNRLNYNTPSTAIQDIVGGNVDAMVIELGSTKEMVASGKLKLLGVTSPERVPGFASVPTLYEQGLRQFDGYLWTGFTIKSGTDPERLRILSEAIVRAVKSPTFREYQQSRGSSEAVGLDYTQAKVFADKEYSRLERLIKQIEP